MLTFKSWTILVLVFQIIVVLVNNSIIKTGLNSVHAFNLPKPYRNIQLRSFYLSDTNKPLPPSFKQINPEKLKRFQNRLINAFISTIFIALAANFLNITSFLLSSTSPDYFRSLNYTPSKDTVDMRMIDLPINLSFQRVGVLILVSFRREFS